MKDLFYFDLDNLDDIFLRSVFDAVFMKKQCNDLLFKFYSSDLKKCFFCKNDFGAEFPDLSFSVFDIGGRKIFGKEAVDRVVSMDVMNDVASGNASSINFISNDYDFYGSLLLIEKFFGSGVEKGFIYEKGKLRIPDVKSDISVLAINTRDKKNELRSKLIDEISKLSIRYDGYNSTEIYALLLNGGVDVKKHIGNNSLNTFLKDNSITSKRFSDLGF